MNAGIDQEGGGGPTYPPVQQGIPLAVAAGNLTLDRVALSVRRLMRVRLRLGMFDPPSLNRYDAITNASVGSAASLAVAERAARKGMTLLRNERVAGGAPALPLSLAALSGKRVHLAPKTVPMPVPTDKLTVFPNRPRAAGIDQLIVLVATVDYCLA